MKVSAAPSLAGDSRLRTPSGPAGWRLPFVTMSDPVVRDMSVSEVREAFATARAFGKELRQLRLMLNETQEVFGARFQWSTGATISQTDMSSIENGHLEPPADVFDAARYFRLGFSATNREIAGRYFELGLRLNQG